MGFMYNGLQEEDCKEDDRAKAEKERGACAIPCVVTRRRVAPCLLPEKSEVCGKGGRGSEA